MRTRGIVISARLSEDSSYKIVVYARSIGGGIGGEMGVLDKIKHIVFERTYSDLYLQWLLAFLRGGQLREIENIFHKKVENVSLETKDRICQNNAFPNELFKWCEG